MPGLTLNTQAATAATQSDTPNHISQTPIPVPTMQQTPVPVPIPYTSASTSTSTAAFASTTTPHEPDQPTARSASPARPAYSPITPPLNPTQLPPRPAYTHSSHADAIAAAIPPPDPIDFDSNPDVLALKSAISVLQMQRRKAERDMATLDRVRSAAVAQPEAFVRDLTSGRAGVEGSGRTQNDDSSSDTSDSSDDEDNENVATIPTNQETKSKPAKIAKVKTENIPEDDPPPWTAIPKPQNIVRCPPINWSQYAVVGPSLDRLHNDQVQRPAQGTPATITADGQFEFKAGEGKQERYVGIAAPYAPGKDRIDRKIKIPPKP
ncbi:hypothetical protein F5Y16DRAFT_404680 [Xylariaceae sp. FL0255]|nr:hypothetical protein F5Y16DRAFT_404680 [Xylariaceae sp. FL0255]